MTDSRHGSLTFISGCLIAAIVSRSLAAVISAALTPAATLEQLDAILRFEAADLRGDRGLAEAEFLRRLGDAAQAGSHLEGFELGTRA